MYTQQNDNESLLNLIVKIPTWKRKEGTTRKSQCLTKKLSKSVNAQTKIATTNNMDYQRGP
jgi:hypothetical protein